MMRDHADNVHKAAYFKLPLFLEKEDGGLEIFPSETMECISSDKDELTYMREGSYTKVWIDRKSGLIQQFVL